jgi:hypothetical protein
MVLIFDGHKGLNMHQSGGSFDHQLSLYDQLLSGHAE